MFVRKKIYRQKKYFFLFLLSKYYFVYSMCQNINVYYIEDTVRLIFSCRVAKLRTGTPMWLNAAKTRSFSLPHQWSATQTYRKRKKNQNDRALEISSCNASLYVFRSNIIANTTGVHNSIFPQQRKTQQLLCIGDFSSFFFGDFSSFFFENAMYKTFMLIAT